MTIRPPVAPRQHHVEQRHGTEVHDPYFWLRDDERKRPEVLAYLDEENVYTNSVMKPTQPLQQRLYDEMVGRIKETDRSVPVRKNGYFYYSRTEEGKQYRIYCRKKGDLEAPEEILLDENSLAEGRPYLRVGAFAVSPDHNLLAYATDFDGSEKYTLRVKDLRTGEMLPDAVEAVYYSVEWANDSRTLFYNRIDDAHRPHRLFRHTLGTAPQSDLLIHEEPDDAFFLSLRKTKDERYLILQLESSVTSEEWYLDAAKPECRFAPIQPRRQNVEYVTEHRDGTFYILTNEGAVNFKLVETAVETPRSEHWKDLIPHDPQVKLDGIEVFRDHLALPKRQDGLRGIVVVALPSREVHEIEFPEPVYTVVPSGNVEFDSDTLRFRYESMTTPDSTYDYRMTSHERVLLKRQEVLGGYDSERYVSERLHAPATDGRLVPVSLVYRKGARDGGPAPLLLYGYGSYGHTIDPGFSSTRVSLLDRGVIFAIAHVRGGGALGRPWYDDGKLLKKRNTFTDFISAAEHLVSAGYTKPDRLAIRGGSAGGLLVGAVVNMRPELIRVAVANVPFVDVISTMLDRTVPLTVIEWEEWGDPRKPEFYEYMCSYSPYDNVEAKSYPAMLVTSGLNDPRVAYWEPAKWVAKLRATKTDGNPLLLKTNMGAGHSGASGRYDELEELALEYAFILTRIDAAR